MFKEILLLLMIYSTSILYNIFISPFLLTFISQNIYNNLIISLVILTQIDNFILYMDYKNKDIKLIKDINMENFNIIMNQLKILTQKNYMKKIKKIIKLNKSYNDLSDLKNDLIYLN